MAIDGTPALQETRRETTRKLIRARAELEILQLDKKQARYYAPLAFHDLSSTD